MNRLRQDGTYFIQGIAGTWAVIGAVAVLIEALLLVLNATAPGRWSEVLTQVIPSSLPLGLFLTTIAEGIYLAILTQIRFVRRSLAIKIMTVLGAIALIALILSVLAQP